MESETLKTIEYELLEKAVKGNLSVINTHRGMSNHLEFSNGELEILNELANRIFLDDLTIVINHKAFTPFISNYNGSNTLVGLKITTIIS
jgi:hypothetical protein